MLKDEFCDGLKCFWKTIISVLKHEGVVEGGTGALVKERVREKEVISK